MKKQNLKDFKNKTVKELNIQVNNLNKELANLRVDLSLGKLKNAHVIKHKKKDIARLLTLMSYKSQEQFTKAQVSKDVKSGAE